MALDARISVLPDSAFSPAARNDCCFNNCSKLFCSECRVAKRLLPSCRKGLPHSDESAFNMCCAFVESKLGHHCCAAGCSETGSELNMCRHVDITGMQLAGQGANPGLACGHGTWRAGKFNSGSQSGKESAARDGTANPGGVPIKAKADCCLVAVVVRGSDTLQGSTCVD